MKKFAAILSAAICMAFASAAFAAGGTVTFAIGMEPTTLMPFDSSDTGSLNVMSQMYDTLLGRDGEMNIIPCIAEKWEIVSPTSVRFHIRRGVKFHNGETLTANDVIFSIKRAAASASEGHSWRPVDFDASKVEDDYTLLLVTKEPYPALLSTCADVSAFVVCKSAVEADAKAVAEHPIGSGAFKFVARSTGDFIRMEANPDWWGGKVAFDELMIRYIPEATTRAIEAESGNIEIAVISVEDAANAGDVPGVKLLTQQTLNTGFLSFNCSIEPFNDSRVRQAISLALDPAVIASASSFGLSDVSYSFFAPAILGYKKVESEYTRVDIEAAKKLLADAGYPNGFKTTLVSNGRQPICEMIQASLAAIGIDVDLNIVDFSNWLDTIINGRQQMYIGGWTITNADPSGGASAFSSKEFGPINRSFYANARADQLVDIVDSETDSAKRAEAFGELQQLIVDECAIIPLWVGANYYLYSDKLEGFYVKPSQIPVFSGIKITD